MTAGVSGHQHLGSAETAAWVRQQMSHAVDHYSVSRGYTSLAIGADQLFAEVLAARQIPFVAIIPCDNYITTFASSSAAEAFQRLLSRAQETIRLPFKEPSEEAFFEAGKAVSDRAATLIVVWNGRPARGLGGTGDIVSYATTKGRRVVHINPLTRTVAQLP